MNTKAQTTSPAPVKEPDWKGWLDAVKVFRIENEYMPGHNFGFCSCCGAGQVLPNGESIAAQQYRSKSYKDSYDANPRYYEDAIKTYSAIYKNAGRITLGVNQTKEHFFETMEIAPETPYFVFEDGDTTHVLAWRDE